MVSFRVYLMVVFSLHGISAVMAQQDPPIPPTPAGNPGSIGRMDYGPVMAHTIHAKSPAKNTAYKGLAIQLTEVKSKSEAVIIYDTDLMRVAAAAMTKDGLFLDISKTNHTSYKGVDDAHLVGTQIMGTPMTPGWADPAGTGKTAFKDPRSYPNGPLPKAWTQFKGHYRHGGRVLLKYTVGDAEVLELPGIETIDEYTFITRSIEVGKSARELRLLIADVEKDFNLREVYPEDRWLILTESAGLAGELGLDSDDPRAIFSAVAFDAKGEAATIKPKEKDRRITLTIPAAATPLRFKLLHWAGSMQSANGGDPKDLYMYAGIRKAIKKARPPAPLADFLKGGPAQWKEPVEIKGARSTAKSAYVIDTLTVPERNPWNSWMRLVGFDFFKDGTRAAVSTWNGDVWIVSGIDDKLEKLTWKRFATGLYEPLGLVVKDDAVYALGYDRITRLHDLNGDGEADYYENFHSGWITHPKAYTLCLSTDSKGDFYTIANGNRAHGVPLHGCVHRIAADGSKLEVFATGLRSANGLGIGPDDRVAVADQEGNWTPASRIDIVKRGDFIGYKPHAPKGNPQANYKPPLCWLPKDVDNSAGDLIWAPDDPQSRWGPMKGRLLGTSYGMCSLYVVPYETVMKDGQPIEQGGVVAFPLNFSSGIMRARFNNRDGQLYVAGLKGWQTRAAFDSGFYRVRYTGGKAHMPIAIHPTKTGVTLTFTDPLDAEVAEDVSSYQVLRWNYIYSEKYGSPEMSVADPKKQGRDAMKVTAARLSKDGRTIALSIDDMQPVMQMMVKMNLESAEGETIKREVYHTVHVLGE